MQSNAATSTPATPVIMAKTPSRPRRLSKVEQTLAEVDHFLDHCGPQMGTASAPSAPISTKMLLEDAMTEAENGQWRLAMSKVRRANNAGALTKNVRAAADYIKTFIPADVMKRQLARPPGYDGPPGYDEMDLVDLAACRVQVKVRTDNGATALGLGGDALCEINKNRVLSLLPQNATGVRSRHKWPLQLLRRFGKEGKSFYFEAGRRCPSGPVMLYLDGSTTDVTLLLQTANTALDGFRKEATEQKNEELDALRKYKGRVQAEEAQKQKEHEAAMATHRRETEAIATKQIAERARQEAQAQQDVAVEAASKLQTERLNVGGGESLAGRAAFRPKRNAVDEDRQRRALQLNISERAARAAAPKESASSSIGFVDQDEWGAGKSKIWKALNPRPLAYQTAKERAEKEDKIDMGAVGVTRDYTNFDLDEEEHADELGESHENSEDEEDEEVNPDQLADFDSDFARLLKENRAKRAKEEAARKHKLQQDYLARQKTKQAALDKELAVIAAKKKIEEAEATRLADLAVADSQKNAEALVFDFCFSASFH